MAEKSLETTISMTDKFSKTVVDFEKKLYGLLKPVDKINGSLEKLGKAFQFEDLGKSLGLLKKSSTDLFFNLHNTGKSFGYIKDVFKGVVSLLDKTTARGDSLAKTSKRLGFTVEELQKFEYVADLAGVSSENFTKGIKQLSRASVEAAGGQEELKKAFKSLGIGLKNKDGSLKSSQELLFSLADRFAETGKRELSSSEKIFAANKILGKSGVELITVLDQGSEAIKSQMDELVSLGIVKNEDAKKSEKYRDEVSKLKRAIDNLSFSVAGDLLGPMTESVVFLTNYMKKNKDSLVKSIMPFIQKIPEMTKVFTDALPGVIEAFKDVAATVSGVVDFVGVKWPILITVFSGVGIPLVLMIYSAVKSFLLLLNTIGRVAYFFKTAFSGSAKKASLSTETLSNKLNKTSVSAKRTESRFRSLLSSLKKVSLGFDKVGSSAKKASLNVSKSGNSAVMSSRKMAGALAAAWAVGDAFERLTDSEDERYKNKSGFDKALRVFADVIEDIPIFGNFVKGIENLSVDKVDFGDSGVDDLSSLMNLDESNLFKEAMTTKTINNNTRSSVDINLRGFPKETVVTKRGFDDPTLYGFSMAPAF